MADGLPEAVTEQGATFPRPPGRWRPLALAIGCGLSVVLFASWILDPTRSWWLALDESVFWTLNASLACCGLWQGFWAVVNSRAGDVVAALGMAGLYLHFIYRQARTARKALFSIGVMLTGLIIIGNRIGAAIPIHRRSGTMVHEAALRLSELVTWIPTKDISGDSFPGDHGTVLLICAGVITFYLPRRYAAVAWGWAAAFMLPRLVSGAHWFTDDFVGSVAIAGLVISCTFATPLHRVVVDRIERMIGKIWN